MKDKPPTAKTMPVSKSLAIPLKIERGKKKMHCEGNLTLQHMLSPIQGFLDAAGSDISDHHTMALANHFLGGFDNYLRLVERLVP